MFGNRLLVHEIQARAEILHRLPQSSGRGLVRRSNVGCALECRERKACEAKHVNEANTSEVRYHEVTGYEDLLVLVNKGRSTLSLLHVRQ